MPARLRLLLIQGCKSVAALLSQQINIRSESEWVFFCPLLKIFLAN